MADITDSLIVDKRAGDDPKTLKHEDQFISRFGSRFSISLNLTGREKAIFPMGLGPLGGEMPIFLAVSQGGQTTSLPMHYPVFDKTTAPVYDAEFRRTMAAATADIGTHGNLRIEWRFESPFYPQDYRLSCGPFFHITARLTNISDQVSVSRDRETVCAGYMALRPS